MSASPLRATGDVDREVASQRPSARHAAQSGDAYGPDIVLEKFDVPQTACAHKDRRRDEQHERYAAKIAASRQPLHTPSKTRGEVTLRLVAPEQLPGNVGREPLLPKFDPVSAAGPATAAARPPVLAPAPVPAPITTLAPPHPPANAVVALAPAPEVRVRPRAAWDLRLSIANSLAGGALVVGGRSWALCWQRAV